jgi:polyisoprenoid-binding protein YceI
MRRSTDWWIVLVCVWFVASADAVAAGDWRVVPGGDGTEARFVSEATVESFEGRTHVVEGWISTTHSSESDSIAWHVAVDLASIDTGIGLRNRHMRENHLHTDEFPDAVFAGSMAWPAELGALVEGQTASLEFSGQFELHGVSRSRTIPVQMTLGADGSLEARAEFTVSLAAHGIPRPKFLMLKLADEQQVEINLLAVPSGARP